MRLLLAALAIWLSLFCAAPRLLAQSPSPKQQEPQSQTVYITRMGKRYHRDGCRYLASGKIPISLKDAKAKGYTACKVCHPPE